MGRFVFNYNFSIGFSVNETLDVSFKFHFRGFVGGLPSGAAEKSLQRAEQRLCPRNPVPCLFLQASVNAQGIAVAGVRLKEKSVARGLQKLLQSPHELLEIFHLVHVPV
jgi:hypothetical protein